MPYSGPQRFSCCLSLQPNLWLALIFWDINHPCVRYIHIIVYHPSTRHPHFRTLPSFLIDIIIITFNPLMLYFVLCVQWHQIGSLSLTLCFPKQSNHITKRLELRSKDKPFLHIPCPIFTCPMLH